MRVREENERREEQENEERRCGSADGITGRFAEGTDERRFLGDIGERRPGQEHVERRDQHTEFPIAEREEEILPGQRAGSLWVRITRAARKRTGSGCSGGVILGSLGQFLDLRAVRGMQERAAAAGSDLLAPVFALMAPVMMQVSGKKHLDAVTEDFAGAMR